MWDGPHDERYGSVSTQRGAAVPSPLGGTGVHGDPMKHEVGITLSIGPQGTGSLPPHINGIKYSIIVR